MLEKAKQFVDQRFKKKSVVHFKRTIYWAKQLDPAADEAMLIAAYTHDIERSFNIAKRESRKFESGKILKVHQREGGKIMYEFLIKNGAEKKFAKRVQELIEKHEEGGTKDQNIIKDADSISYLENNAPRHAKLTERGFTKEEIKRKFDWMFNRISSKKTKQIAEPFYKNAIDILEVR